MKNGQVCIRTTFLEANGVVKAAKWERTKCFRQTSSPLRTVLANYPIYMAQIRVEC